MDSLSHDLPKPILIDSEKINSPLISDLCKDYCEKLLEIPCIQQPYGHSCGMACNLNAAVALMTRTYEKLATGGLDDTLKKFKWPERNDWTNWDFVVATSVLIDAFAKGPQEIPKLSTVMIEIGKKVAQKRAEAKEKKAKEKNEKADLKKKQDQKGKPGKSKAGTGKQKSSEGQKSITQFFSKKRKGEGAPQSPRKKPKK